MMNENAPKEAPAWAWQILADFCKLMRGREDEVHQAVARWIGNRCLPFCECEDVPDAVGHVVGIAMIADKFDSGTLANAIGLKAFLPKRTPDTELKLMFRLPVIDQDGTLDWQAARQEVEAAWGVVKRHFSPPSKGGENHAPQTGWKHGKLILKAVPNGRTPGVFTFGRKAYTVPSGQAWACVCGLIEAGGFDAHGVPMRSPGAMFKREHRAFFTERMTSNASGWYIRTV